MKVVSEFCLIKWLQGFLTMGILLVPMVVDGGPATVLSASFEAAEVPSWTVIQPDAYTVAWDTQYFEGSNLDGVAGERFLLFGIGNERGTIRFTVSTVPGKTYTLSYFCGATDTQTIPSGEQLQIKFSSLVQAFYGVKTILNHLDELVEIDDLETLATRVHPFTTPGTWNWRIHQWLPVNYEFVAKSSTTRIEFSTPFTTGMASVGVLDQVLVTTNPFAEISRSEGGMKLDFAGKLQQSGDLLHWEDASPQPKSPYILTPEPEGHFFRVEK